MIVLALATAILLLLSFIADRGKTLAGLRKGAKMFLNILPAMLGVLILVSVFLYIVPASALTGWLGQGSGWAGIASAALLGSISLIPGRIRGRTCAKASELVRTARRISSISPGDLIILRLSTSPPDGTKRVPAGNWWCRARKES